MIAQPQMLTSISPSDSLKRRSRLEPSGAERQSLSGRERDFYRFSQIPHRPSSELADHFDLADNRGIVFRFEGRGGSTNHRWGVYGGNAAQVRSNGPLLMRRDGVTVHRATEDGKFRGYLAEKGGWQNHFFGSVFDGSTKDKAFFDRIDFGPKGQALCARGR